MFNAHTSAVSIEYRPRNRNTYIRITSDGEVKVRTPLKSESMVRRILKLREGWIKNKLYDLRIERKNRPVLGEAIRFRGETYSVEQLPALQKKLEKCKNDLDIEKYYYKFYKDEAILTLPSRVSYYARKMNLHPKELRFKKLRSRWGSCDSKGTVTLNIMMMQLSYEQIDYIIVHELAHLRHMNHSKQFHDLVKEYLPESTKLRRELKAIRPSL